MVGVKVSVPGLEVSLAQNYYATFGASRLSEAPTASAEEPKSPTATPRRNPTTRRRRSTTRKVLNGA